MGNSARLSVTRIAPWALAVPAIRASGVGIVRPFFMKSAWYRPAPAAASRVVAKNSQASFDLRHVHAAGPECLPASQKIEEEPGSSLVTPEMRKSEPSYRGDSITVGLRSAPTHARLGPRLGWTLSCHSGCLVGSTSPAVARIASSSSKRATTTCVLTPTPSPKAHMVPR